MSLTTAGSFKFKRPSKVEKTDAFSGFSSTQLMMPSITASLYSARSEPVAPGGALVRTSVKSFRFRIRVGRSYPGWGEEKEKKRKMRREKRGPLVQLEEEKYEELLEKSDHRERLKLQVK